MAKYPDEKNARHARRLCASFRRPPTRTRPAVEAVREALKLDPNDTEAQLLLGLVLSQTGKVDEAIEIAPRRAQERPGQPRLQPHCSATS